MRHIPTDAERKFWWQVRDRRLAGYKFKRQWPIGKYIVDFVCLECGLIVELDGGQHSERVVYDAARAAFLAAAGYRVMRFWNDEVLKNMEAVIEGVLIALKEKAPPLHFGDADSAQAVRRIGTGGRRSRCGWAGP